MTLSQKTPWGRAYATSKYSSPDGVYVLNIEQQLGAAAALSAFPKHFEMVSIKSMKKMGFIETRLNCTKSMAWNAL